LTGFAAFLRANGFALGGADVLSVLECAERVGVLDATLLRWSLKALLCGRSEDWQRFDKLFDAWFLPANRWQEPEAREGAPPAPGMDESAGVSAHDAPDNETDETDALRPRDTPSSHEGFESADFRTLTEREHLLDIEALMRRFARGLRPILLRRHVPALAGGRLDLPATIRQSIEHGGTPLALAWKDRRRIPPRLILLIDVSRSMTLYSFFYLRLARALSAELAGVYSFIFHTRITAVSRALCDPDPWRAQENLHLLAQGWAGGTRIGESLIQFEREHAARLVNSHTGILIMSDGYDTGEPALLARALARLGRRARRIVWLNPLCNRPGYAPISLGMQAARPHLDLLAPGADLASIKAVLPNLIAALG
jgi:uncharacterized protein with von Willebrand factor type A (vWA) domain